MISLIKPKSVDCELINLVKLRNNIIIISVILMLFMIHRNKSVRQGRTRSYHGFISKGNKRIIVLLPNSIQTLTQFTTCPHGIADAYIIVTVSVRIGDNDFGMSLVKVPNGVT